MSQIPPTDPNFPGNQPQPLGYAPPPIGAFNWPDFITFRTMIAVPTIMILFWIGVVASILGGFVTMFRGGMQGVCSGLAIILLGPFFVRLYCEFLIVVFRINETLTEILHTLRGRPPM